MFQRILVPLDGSRLAEAILPDVLELAAQQRAEVVLLRVALAHALPAVELTEAQVHVVEEAERYLADVEHRLAGRGIRVSNVVRYGRAAEEILDHARTSDIDLIAMSTHGRSGIERVLLGSVAERVLREAPVPVFLRRAAPPAPAGAGAEVQEARAPVRPHGAASSPRPIGHILCPVDFSPTSYAAMAQAGLLAQRFSADLTVLHVVYDPLDVTCLHIPHPPEEQLREELIREAERTLQAQVRRRLRSLPRAKTAVVLGMPFREIVRYAQAHGVDLIVMGTQGLSGLNHLIMGSTAERVVRMAACPVLSIRAAA
ncbi:MAG: universal stress protein [Candidatus Methylomirabilota bacterium]